MARLWSGVFFIGTTLQLWGTDESIAVEVNRGLIVFTIAESASHFFHHPDPDTTRKP